MPAIGKQPVSIEAIKEFEAEIRKRAKAMKAVVDRMEKDSIIEVSAQGQTQIATALGFIDGFIRSCKAVLKEP